MRPAVAAIVVAVGIVTVLGLIAAAPVIPSATLLDEAMFAPAVTIAPTRPGTHAKKNTVIEVSRPVKSIGRATVGRSFIIAPTANRWSADFYFDTRNANADDDLRVCGWHHGQTDEQCCRSDESCKSSHK
jgi:hypothetical protein